MVLVKQGATCFLLRKCSENYCILDLNEHKLLRTYFDTLIMIRGVRLY